ncbi:type III PLP-dependent enzyme [Paenibacillus sp. HB172176]|uniref:type III PLP-dependent enzyme n=1 Tax=Paenibacillus sp. HB172176 TaxID=2493690 RepID=UPI0014393980|nr:type III PLP-dependent enzyme [Paenibacillus sp. HB172176]
MKVKDWMSDKEVLVHLARRHGTPYYFYDAAVIGRQYEALKGAMPERWELFYSLKANPLGALCELLRGCGCRCEVASAGELTLALRAGFDPSDIVFTGPGKTDAELEAAVAAGIYSINVESVREAARLSEIAQRRHRTVKIAVRINPDLGKKRSGLAMSGVASQFGIDEGEADEAVQTILKLPGLLLCGVHVYNATQMLSADDVADGMAYTIRLALRLSRTHQFPLDFLDLGGGFGIPYFPGEQRLDMERLRGRLAELWSEARSSLRGTRMAVESGRFLLADSGCYVSSVLDAKRSKGKRYIVCDGGSHHHAAAAFLGRYVRNNYVMSVISEREEAEAELEETYVAGPLCTPADLLGQRVALPPAQPGDLLVVEQSGAYGLTHSPLAFLSHPTPREWLMHEGETRLVRDRMEPLALGGEWKPSRRGRELTQ